MGLVSYLRDRARRHRAHAELLGLDDRLLRDIGLTRGDLVRSSPTRKRERD
jgi:uncharacterized protein YjiS (DUF1127 family)